MEILEKFCIYGKAKPEMFYESEKVVNDRGLVDWVSNFNINIIILGLCIYIIINIYNLNIFSMDILNIFKFNK